MNAEALHQESVAQMAERSALKVALAMSGGGFRASLFHLGVLKRLDELRILGEVDCISGVSGGALMSALYVYLKRELGTGFSLNELETRFLRGVKKNPRTRWLLLTLLLRLSLRLLPLRLWSPFEEWLRRTFAFDNFFRNEFFGAATLGRLDPAKRPEDCAKFPRLILNTTGLETGQGFFLTPDYIGPQKLAALGLQPAALTRADPERLALAQAVGASACVPAIFPPYTVPVTPNREDDRGIELPRVRLVDGGVYDNQGLGVFLREHSDPYIGKPQDLIRKVDFIIASDASKTLSPSAEPLPTNPLKRFLVRFELLRRSHSITEDQARWERFALLLYELEAKDLDQAAFFHTDSKWQEAPPFQLPDRMKHNLARLRTDFDSFSDLEIVALMYLGYTLVNHRIFSYCRDLLPAQIRAAFAGVPLGPTPWQAVVNRLGGPPPGVAPLMTWDNFAADISQRLPRRAWIIRFFVRWLERPWRSFLDEANPTQPRNTRAVQMAILHLEHGATTSLLWRGLQRLGDRGGLWKLIARLGQILVVVVLVYAVVWLLSPVIRWLDHLAVAMGSLTQAILGFIKHFF